MASHSALTEEGRTRIRNFHGRIKSYLLLWIVIGIGVVVGGIFVKTQFGYQPLQRLYLNQYLKASIKSLIPSKRPSKYILLVRIVADRTTGVESVVACTDDEVTPIRDDDGRVKFDPKLGPFFRLREGIPHKYFYWTTIWQQDDQMYSWLRDHIYQGLSPIGLFWFCFPPLPLVVIVGMIVSIKVDIRTNREYEEGSLLRGIRLLQHREYGRETKEFAGLGLPVLSPERRLR
ncbi:MAG TPA: hypothetical protein VI306_09115 [Pyrinomonadaceae bacterium]